jgi:16S rRNA (guanine527-N7)-methyltransferase
MVHWDALKKILHEKQPSIPIDFWDKIDVFENLINTYNEALSLTSSTDRDKIHDRHISDSLALLLFIDLSDFKSCLDIGAGAGFPGIVLSAAFPKCSFTLCDSSHKKTKFLNLCVDKLNLKNVTIYTDRAENIKDKFDLITIRAVGPLKKTIPTALKKIEANGIIAVWVGRTFIQNIGWWKSFIKKRNGQVKIFPYPSEIFPKCDLSIAIIKGIEKTQM